MKLCVNPFRSLDPPKTSVFFKPLVEQPLEPAPAFLLAPPLWLLMGQQWGLLLLQLLLLKVLLLHLKVLLLLHLKVLLLQLLLLKVLLLKVLLLLLRPLWQETGPVSSQVEGKAT